MPPNLMPRREPQTRSMALAEDRPPEGLFELSSNERSSNLWLRLKTELTKRLQKQREQNDGPLDAEATARARGHIECLREILSLGDEPPTQDE